jgi:hypothetical protein
VNAAAALALAFQAATAVDASPPQTIEPAAAAGVFVDVCWRGLRDESRFIAAIRASPLGFAGPTIEREQRHYRSAQANIYYGRGNCSLTVNLTDEAKARQYAEDISQALGLRAPEFSWVADAGDMRAIHWRDVPIDDGAYRFRGAIMIPNLVRDSNGSVRVEVWLAYLTRRVSSQ